MSEDDTKKSCQQETSRRILFFVFYFILFGSFFALVFYEDLPGYILYPAVTILFGLPILLSWRASVVLRNTPCPQCSKPCEFSLLAPTRIVKALIDKSYLCPDCAREMQRELK